MTSRFPDPIVEEVRRVRAELAAKHGNDVAAIIRHAQELERTLGLTCVRYPPRRVVPADASGPEPRGMVLGTDEWKGPDWGHR